MFLFFIFSDVKRLMGRRFSDVSVQNDIKLWPFKVVDDDGNKPKIIVQYKGEVKKFTPEESSLRCMKLLRLILALKLRML